MSVAPSPAEIFDRAVKEGKRRLQQSWLELTSTGFIAGFTILFGIAAGAIVQGAFVPGPIAEIAGALAFAIGIVLLFVGRAELFSEDFFDPVAAVVDKREPGMVRQLLRLWVVTFVLNLVGGGVLALLLSVEGVLGAEAREVLAHTAEELARRGAWAILVSGIAGGALVTLLSYVADAANSVGSRIAVTYLTGFLLGLGPFDHVIVTTLNIFFGILAGAHVGVVPLLVVMALVTAGNLVGGLGLVTLTHIAQAKGAEEFQG